MYEDISWHFQQGEVADRRLLQMLAISKFNIEVNIG